MAYLNTPQPSNEPFTMFPHIYTDSIQPLLTDTEHAICDAVLRQTIGWHRPTAAISNAMFMTMTGKSEPAIIRAKSALEKIGLLVVLKRGGGASTTRYMLDLYYDDPERSVKASLSARTPTQDTTPESVAVDHQETPETSEPATTPSTDTTGDTAMDSTGHEGNLEGYSAEIDTRQVPDITDIQTNIQDADMDTTTEGSRTGAATPIGEIVNGVMGRMAAAQYSDQQYSDQYAPDPSVPEIPDTAEAPEPAVTEAPEEPTPNVTLVPGPDLSSNIIYINKHTEAEKAEPTPTPENHRKGISTVCYEFLRVFPESEQKPDWLMMGWAVKTYGVDVCLYKLKLLKEYRKQCVVENPYGLFRMALTRDYQPNRYVREKLKADEKARRALERSQQENQKWEEHVSSFNYDAAQAAIQNLMDSIN